MASKFEEVVARLLTNARIPFEREKRFPDLKHGYLRFDFYLPTMNILLEVDGQQHMVYTKIFHKKRSDFTKAQERDRAKNSYALAHEIKLYRIPYWEKDNLKIAEDLFNPKFLVKSKFHNDEVYREYKKRVE